MAVTMDVTPIPGFSQPFSSLTHLLGAGVCAALSVMLVRRGWGKTGRPLALGVFAWSCVLLLSMRGIYHLLDQGTEARGILRRLDHAAIFTLIAGTFTAAHAVLFRGLWRWGMVSMVWALALTGVALKLIWFERVTELQGLCFYLGLGWVGLISGVKVVRSYGWPVLRPLLWGGVAYTVGAVLEFLRWPVLIPQVVGPHELFHLAVLAGVACHWVFLHRFADVEPLEPTPRQVVPEQLPARG